MPITDDDLKRAFQDWPEFERLEGVRETENEWHLGLLYVHKQLPQYRYGYAFDTSETSRFLKRRMDFSDIGVRGWAAVFRQFDRFNSEDDPPEFAIGWVPDEQEADLDGWIALLNERLRERRAHRA